MKAEKRLALFLPDLAAGGAERLQLDLAPLFAAAGWQVTLLLQRRGGAWAGAVPDGIASAHLEAASQFTALPRLVSYLRQTHPKILVANTEHGALTALAARRIAGAETRIVIIQHASLRRQVEAHHGWRHRALPALLRLGLPKADAVVAVSHGVADELAAMTGLAREHIAIIHNGIALAGRAAGPPHPWFSDGGGPVLLAIGRLVPQKDFVTLMRAMARIAGTMPPRLVILGEGPQRAALSALIEKLGLQDRVALPGFSPDPGAALRAARLFVSSSRYEGFGNAIAEALLAGCPVVATDCPFGPAEILGPGRFGRLVPVGDAEAMAAAILDALAETPDPAALRAHGQEFSLERCAASYLTLFEAILTDR